MATALVIGNMVGSGIFLWRESRESSAVVVSRRAGPEAEADRFR